MFFDQRKKNQKNKQNKKNEQKIKLMIMHNFDVVKKWISTKPKHWMVLHIFIDIY